MRLSNFDKDEKDPIEHVKQQIQELQLVLDNKLIPNKNHILFEYDLSNRVIRLAEMRPSNTTISYEEALNMYNNKVLKKIKLDEAETKSKYDVLKKENCIYVMSLNEENAMKKIKRDFGHIINWL